MRNAQESDKRKGKWAKIHLLTASKLLLQEIGQLFVLSSGAAHCRNGSHPPYHAVVIVCAVLACDKQIDATQGELQEKWSILRAKLLHLHKTACDGDDRYDA